MRATPAGLLAAIAVTGSLALAGCSGINSAPAKSAAADSGTTSAGSAAESGESGGSESPSAASESVALKELPGGGRTIHPTYRLVGYAGAAGTGSLLGRAGVGDLDERMTEMVERAQPYAADGKKILPTLEFIATVVQPKPMKSGCWNTRASDERVKEHLDAIRKVKGILLLAIQPGRCDFVSETKYYEKWLKEPDVGVALDPEWRMGPGQIPMRVFGSAQGKELDDTAAYLAQIVKDNGLPEKVMLFHMLRRAFVKNIGDLSPHEGVAQMVSIDGIGNRGMKLATWKNIMAIKPKHVLPGFKLFYEEDTQHGWALMTPKQVMALTPTPEYVLYE